MRDNVKIKLFAVDQNEPMVRQEVGDDLFAETGKYNYIEMTVDRANDRYHKLIIDGETSVIIRQCDEPLSVHRGRGSARNSRPRRSQA